MENIVARFESLVRLDPDAIAVELEDKKWSYFQLNNYANFIARNLAEKGAVQSAVIAVSGSKSFEMIASILGILKLGCSYMPLDLSLPTSRVQFMLANASIHFIVSHGPQQKLMLNSMTIINLNYKEFNDTLHYQNLNRTISQHDAAYVMHTSGSTGIPKGVVVPHRGVMRLLINTNYIHLRSNDSVLFHSNTSFDAAIFEIWAALLCGARIIISPYLTGDIPAILKLCQDKKITILLLATGLFHIFSTMDLAGLSSLRYLVVGGDVMQHSAAIRAINKSKNFKIINGYGPAENTVFTTCLVIASAADIGDSVSIGQPISGTNVYLLDEALQEVKYGEVGELYTSGAGVALGYINDAKLTAEKFLRIPHIAGNAIIYRTGDMARMIASGHIEFIGRRDNQVKIRGFRIELTEIENVISKLNFVEDVCVCLVGTDNPKIAAYIKIDHSHDSDLHCNKSAIVSFLNEKLPAYCIPSYIEINNTFPLTSNGKLDRKLLQTTFEADKSFLL
ncbi:MAG: hypothetical protein A3F18_06995 [Legionellales bacterium RIFCSPHIGHO2_12_FULL_37_14]|nr:MAG: hypothetical protein A3F18_06995 [Legionellales bacterium RIFCSPHIGHO2_12_FULL_37_14]